ncbi:MAG TPA: hypothetical protein VHE82_05385 [Gemmatimonadaceae bacterium]|nr:hypothetical protein [Gemmatimonadaceae bacterium]
MRRCFRAAKSVPPVAWDGDATHAGAKALRGDRTPSRRRVAAAQLRI